MTTHPQLQIFSNPIHQKEFPRRDKLANLPNRLITILANFLLRKLASSSHTRTMELREIRKRHRLTQAKAASLVGIPYRTYIRYEENAAYQNSYKYKKIVEDLSNLFRIDEERGILEFDVLQQAVRSVLTKHGVSYCYLFGSYARKEARGNSDIDLLIDTDITGMAFFRLVDELRNELHKRVDVLRLSDLQEGNPITLKILKEGIRII